MRKDDRGSTLITVMAGVSFLLILAALMLSVSSAGLRMKQMEYQAKNIHYSDERVLEDLYNGIGKVSAECMGKAYAEVLSQAADSANPVFTTQDAAYRAFSTLFISRLLQFYPECGRNEPAQAVLYDNVLNKLRSYMTVSDEEAWIDGFLRIEKIADTDGVTPCQLIFRDVTVRYHPVDASGDELGYEAVITTDIVVEVPYLNFFQDSSRILDYAVIGNKGVYFNGASGRTVEGNIYAGSGVPGEGEPAGNLVTYRNEAVPGGLNFYNSDVALHAPLIVTKGDINLRLSDVVIENAGSAANAQIWAESIRTVDNQDRGELLLNPEPSSLTINASVYAANDLELNAAESTVVLSGEYYGYNNGTYLTREQESVGADYETSSHARSSSVVINGSRSVLDLSGLSTFLVAGNAYIDIESNAYTGIPVNPGGNLSGMLDEIATGESLALKSNQYIYLAPAECLKTTNPAETDSAPSASEAWAGGVNWFGVSGGFVDPGNPVVAKVVLNRTTGKAYTYYYLNFQPGQQEVYAGTVLNMIDPENDLADMEEPVKNKYQYMNYNEVQWNQIWELKQSAEQKAVSSEGLYPQITLADNATARIYTQGVVSSVSGGSLSSQKPGDNAISLDTASKLKNNLPYHYEWLYTELDPKEQYALASDLLGHPSSLGEAGMPAEKYVDFTKIISNTAGGTSYRYRENRDYRTILRNGNYTVPAGNYKGIIICTGDVTVSSGASVEGIIIAGGRIYVQGGGIIRANRSIVQSILDEEMTEESKNPAGAASRSDYAIYVLKGFTASRAAEETAHRVTGTEYTDYISYRNWRKGEGD